MSKSDPNFALIREQLMASVQTSEPPIAEDAEMLWAPPRSEAGASSPEGLAPEAYQATVATVHQQSTIAGATAPQGISEPSPPPAIAIPAEIDLHRERLQKQAYKINDLAQQQTAAIQAFKRSADSLAWSLHKHHYLGWQVDQFCQIEAAAVPQITQTEAGALILSQAVVDLYQQERDANLTAQALRDRRQPRRTPYPFQQDSAALLVSPWAMGKALWQRLLGHGAQQPLTPLEILGWLGGGLIGRRAVDLLLAAFPALWPLVVGLTVGAVVFALYQLMTAPRTEVSFVLRLLLLLLGLMLGGQF